MTWLSSAKRAFAPLLLIAPVALLAQSDPSQAPKGAGQPAIQNAEQILRNAARIDDLSEAGAERQPQYLNNEEPWLYQGSDLPQDKEWLFGELPNGLRYAVRKNRVPANQVSIRVRVDAGALHERDGEQGFAHLLEHMLFRESKYLGQGEAVPTWQRLGASFGSDTNAETSPTHTVYKLDLPDGRKGNLQESMKLLSGMIQAPVLSPENLALDVPIVLAERRESGRADRRIYDTTRETLYAGTRLADRSTIGTVESLQGATAKSIQAFHQRWYRPENTVVVVVGDADPLLLAKLVEDNYGDWTVPGKPTPAPDFMDVAPLRKVDTAFPVDKARTVAEPGQPRSITYAYLREWEPVQDTVVYNEGLMMDAVATAIINRRLEERARSGGSYLAAEVSQEDVSRTADVTFVVLIPLTEDWQSALDDVKLVIDDSLLRPPSQAEIDREVAEIDISFINQVEQEDIQAGSYLADRLVGAVDIREAVASPTVAKQIWDGAKRRFTPEQMFARTKMLFTSPVVRGVLVTPEPAEADDAVFTAALARPVEQGDDFRSDKKALTFADLPAIGEPAQPVSRKSIGVYEIEQVEYPNGVRALVWNSGNEPGRVTVNVRFGSGWRAFTGDQAAFAEIGEIAMVGTGFGDVSQNGLDELATGRKFGYEFEIGDAAFSLHARTRMDDLEDQLYLFAAKLAAPRYDANPILRAKASARLAYDRYAATAAGVLNRDLEYYLRGKDGRFATANPAEIEAVTPEAYEAVWDPLMRQGPIEVIVFGDIDVEKTVAYIGQTFGALPAREPIPAAAAQRTLGFADTGPDVQVLYHAGDSDEAAAVFAWPTDAGADQLPESRKTDLLSQIFGNRLLEVMRERVGASYAPNVGIQWPETVEGQGYVIAIATLPPEMVPVFFEEAGKIANDLATNGPTEDEIARVTEPMRQLLRRLSSGHTFFLRSLEGATQEPAFITGIDTMAADYTRTTPAEMQALAQKYFGGEGWKMAVLPEGTSLQD
ncbi:M16 family metallopeptidase [Paraurantiacibacter namhicola]|uniref:Protease 3 n=1 Tax=Paraurantiacibacter namhicola TaxID=645517 RepID=A0A1C7D890_9SPHN|nr:M16 family metallopeptidase [Paraurantiacibacter namhicola]ANU07572.1 Protease 3 precursor [Paraurantiacibacter namhicola]